MLVFGWRAGETSLTENEFGLNLRYDVVFEEGEDGEVIEGTERATETRRRRARGPRAMVEQKKRGREGTDTDQGEVKALRQEIERLRARSREEIEGLQLIIAKLEAGCQTPQEEEKEVRLPTEVWAIIAGKIDENDVCSFALVSKQLREAQVLAGRKLVTRPVLMSASTVNYFTEDWCAYWSRIFSVHHTLKTGWSSDHKTVKRVLYVAARHGYLEVFEKYWSQGRNPHWPRDKNTCGWAAFGGHLELVKWLRANGCPWGVRTSAYAARGGQLEVLQWMRAQDPPCPWNFKVCSSAARNGHLEVLRWAVLGMEVGERDYSLLTHD